MIRRLLCLLLCSLCVWLSVTAQPLSGVEHVVLIGIDGLSADGVQQSSTPTLDSLIIHGSASLSAQAVLPTSSSSNWASMMMGTTPERHTITSNDWEPEHLQDTSLCGGQPGALWPTIFRVLRETYTDADLACFHDWSDFDRLIEPGVATMRADTKGPVRTTEAAINYLATYQPLFTMIHLDHVDHAGHEHAWSSFEYKEAVTEADRLIGRITQSLQRIGIADRTVVIVTSDHGGKGTEHGGDTPEERTIPWIVSGPNVRTNYAVPDSVRTFDTAATIAYLLGARPPDCWTGQPISSILIPEAHVSNPEN